MTTKLSQLCDAVIEAGWLLVVILAPLFFNVHSSRVFEPDKISLVRSIALLMAVAWIVKLVNNAGKVWRDGDGEPRSLWQRVRSTPLVLPTLLLVLAYVISTVFSLTPRISWWGSYQRLQGTYTTFSYIIIFFLVLGHLRRPEQWRRLSYAIILTSIPICLYAFLQKADVDPLPWGGDTQRRVAANMGNAIFIFAYLLMAFFLTLQRTLEHFASLLRTKEDESVLGDAVLVGCYLFVLIIQILTVIYTQSRGPFLGLLAGAYVFILIGSLGLRAWAQRRASLSSPLRFTVKWAWLGTILGAIAVIAFLIVFNLPNSPLAGLRTNPYIGRLGTALDMEANTARVRTLIWQGASQLVAPHEPLLSPATSGQDVTVMEPDAPNAVRPLIGYGPEAMWVAFNPFYPPDLAHHESRNASPDRSHNETWDSLVITGVLGYLAYMFLFVSLFYYSLKWLGLIRNRRQSLAFIAIALAFAAISAVLPYLVQRNWILLGVTLPAGLVFGVIVYTTVAALWNESKGLPMHIGRREFLVMTILATLIAHFLEIHFGIAIVSTRTYFWLWSAVLVVIGMNWLPLDTPEPAAAPAAKLSAAAAPSKGRQPAGKGKKQTTPSAAAKAAATSRAVTTRPWAEVTVYAVLMGVVLFTLAYLYVINPNVLALRTDNPMALFINSFTSRVQKSVRVPSPGLLVMTLMVWGVGAALALLSAAQGRVQRARPSFGKQLGIFAAISLPIFLIFGFIHAASIARDASVQRAGSGITLERMASMAAGHITQYFILILVLMAALAAAIWWNRTRSTPAGEETRWLGRGGIPAVGVGVALTILTLVFIFTVNLELVQADVIYKQGQAYEKADRYDEAVFLYQMAIEREPKEDYYYLFLGRAQLEQAKRASGAQRTTYLNDSQRSLLHAQQLNPMNTDHTANLARLYIAWAQMVTGDMRQQMTQKSLDYYSVATRLSPNAAHLHNEYAAAYDLAGDKTKALEQYMLSMQLDSRYVDTYRRLGDYYSSTGDNEQAIRIYEQGVQLSPRNVTLLSSLAYAYAQTGQIDKAIEKNLAVFALRPKDVGTLRNLALLYQQKGNKAEALRYAQAALELVTTDKDRADLQSLIQQLQ